jgi:hypothetical protein
VPDRKSTFQSLEPSLILAPSTPRHPGTPRVRVIRVIRAIMGRERNLRKATERNNLTPNHL